MCDQRSETFSLRVMWAALALLLAAGGLAGVSAQQREIILATTTSPSDAGVRWPCKITNREVYH